MNGSTCQANYVSNVSNIGRFSYRLEAYDGERAMSEWRMESGLRLG